jgi:putative phosphoesterase
MSVARIGVLSDTHLTGPGVELPQALLEAFDTVSAIIHAGDIVSVQVLDRLRQIAPVHAVHGNVDPPDLHSILPAKVVINFEGIRIGVTHGHLGRGATTPECALHYLAPDAPLHAVVFGHSHIPLAEQRHGVLLFNPGSPTQPRRQPRRSCGLLIVEEGLLRAQHIYL